MHAFSEHQGANYSNYSWKSLIEHHSSNVNHTMRLCWDKHVFEMTLRLFVKVIP